MVIPSDIGFWSAVLGLVIGVVILAIPRFSHYLIAVYLIVVGLLGILSRVIGGPS